MRVKVLEKGLAMMLVLCLAFSYTGIGRLALANETDISIGYEGDSSGSGTEEDSGTEVGSESDDSVNGSEGNDTVVGAGSDTEGSSGTIVGLESGMDTEPGEDGDTVADTGSNGADGDHGEDNNEVENPVNEDEAAEAEKNNENEAADAEGNNENEAPVIESNIGGEGDSNSDTTEGTVEVAEAEENTSEAAAVNKGAGDYAEISGYSIEALRALLYEYAGYTGYDAELVDWFIEGFSHDEDLMLYLYESIIEHIEDDSVDVNDSSEIIVSAQAAAFVEEFLSGVYEYRAPQYGTYEEIGDNTGVDEILSAVEEFSQMIAEEKAQEAAARKEAVISIQPHSAIYPRIASLPRNDILPRSAIQSRSFSTAAVSAVEKEKEKEKEKDEEKTYFTNKYVSYLKKTVTKDDTAGGNAIDLFRHYTVDIEFKTHEVKVDIEGQPADIVLVIDKSGSMAGDRLAAMRKAACAFVDGMSNNNKLISDINIGVVAYADANTTSSGTSTYALSDNPVSIKNFINNISADGGTNTQYGILEAKRLLKVKDGEDVNNSERKKIIILLSDGDPTFRYTDVWNWVKSSYSGSSYSISIDSSMPVEGYTSLKGKRWSYAAQASPRRTNQLLINGQSYKSYYWANSGPGSGADAMVKAVTLLEAQYAAGQGIEMYTIDFSGGTSIKELLQDMTYDMTNVPSGFTENSITYNYASGIGVNDKNYSGQRAYSANNASELSEIYEEIKSIVLGEMVAFTVTDELEANFELVPNASLTADKGNASYDVTGNTVTWSITNLTPTGRDSSGQYAIAKLSYRVRVIDDDVWLTGAGLNGSSVGKQPLASETKIAYVPVNTKSGTMMKLAKQPLLTVDPLVDGEAYISLTSTSDSAEAILEGEAVDLSGLAISGNTNYNYQWYKESKVITDAGGNLTGGYGNSLAIPVKNNTVSGLILPAGEYAYTLRIYDNKANNAGYKDTRVLYVEKQVKITVLTPKLIVKVKGEGGADIDGQFETMVLRTPKGEGSVDRQWYFMGLERKEYVYSDGIIQGTYKAGTYVPYGYTVKVAYPAGESDGAVIELKKDASGKWTCAPKEITITIKETNPYYYYDWAWPKEASSSKTAVALIALPAAFVPMLSHKKRKGWFK